jgi:hypothetical protein
VKFVPLDTIVRREQGTSGIKPFKDGLRFMHIIMRVIMLFNPSRIFFPLGLAALACGFIWGMASVFLQGLIPATATILIIAGFLILLNGLLAEQIAQIRLNQTGSIDAKDES